MEEILSQLKRIQEDISEIKKDISDIKGQTTKMDDHVNFVNDVYDKVKAPLSYACNAINVFSLTSSKDYESLPDQDVKLLDNC